MVAVVSRDAYFETGLQVLSDLGYGGLKLAEVCNRLGVTTGSFHHYFANWAEYTRELVDHWQQVNTTRLIESIRGETDPRRRIDGLIHIGLNLPHGAEAAQRTWRRLDPDVHTVQVAVDKQRHDIMRESALEILRDERQAGWPPIEQCICWSGTNRPPAPRQGRAGMDRRPAARCARRRPVRQRPPRVDVMRCRASDPRTDPPAWQADRPTAK